MAYFGRSVEMPPGHVGKAAVAAQRAVERADASFTGSYRVNRKWLDGGLSGTCVCGVGQLRATNNKASGVAQFCRSVRFTFERLRGVTQLRSKVRFTFEQLRGVAQLSPSVRFTFDAQQSVPGPARVN